MNQNVKIRVADVIANTMAQHGVEKVFMVTGGGAMHLNDALGSHAELQYIACHHEQTCAMAADAYFRSSGKLACVNVTTGPGGTNAITGVFGAWTDSIGMVVISGQVKWETLVRSTQLPLRQLGDQEVDIIRMVEGITKYAVIIKDPLSIKYHLEKAIYLAKAGRPGPVWIDVPIDIQATLVDPSELKGFDPTTDAVKEGFEEAPVHIRREQLKPQLEQMFSQLSRAQRPVIMVGGGIRASQSFEAFLQFAQDQQIPVATCWNAHDVLWDEHPLYVGRPGSIGNRAGNFAVQNSDCVLILGSRLNIRQVSYNYQSFARKAYKIMVDVDPAEIQKPTLNIDLGIIADLKDFFAACKEYKGTPGFGAFAALSTEVKKQRQEWLQWCQERVKKYPVCLPEYWELKNNINPYCFVDTLFKHLQQDDWVVTGDGTACVATFQGAILKQGQRLYTNSGCASMGFDIPAAIGAHFAKPPKKLICIAGDGSIQMNLQDLQTLVTYKIPVTLFVLNNRGYHSIRQTQHSFFKGRVVGCGEESGLNFPDMEKIAYAYGIPFTRLNNHQELNSKMPQLLAPKTPMMGPQLCEIMLDLEQSFSPKLSSRKLPDGKMVTSPMEDMAPFLSRDELQSNMLFTIEKDAQ